MARVIYEPRGRAKEYSALACNLYRGCSHGCLYCYAPAIQFSSRRNWTENISPRDQILECLRLDVQKMKGDHRTVLLCFLCDPYQPIDDELKITRSAIQILGENGFRVQILTKGGKRASRDFDLLKSMGLCLARQFFSEMIGSEKMGAICIPHRRTH